MPETTTHTRASNPVILAKAGIQKRSWIWIGAPFNIGRYVADDREIDILLSETEHTPPKRYFFCVMRNLVQKKLGLSWMRKPRPH